MFHLPEFLKGFVGTGAIVTLTLCWENKPEKYGQKQYILNHNLTKQSMNYEHIDGLIQERRNSIANALELSLSCTNPSI